MVNSPAQHRNQVMNERVSYRRASRSKPSFPGGLQLVRMILRTGPMRLLTSRISLKCAFLMVLLCIPSLVVCATMTLPGLIFQSPQQNTFYHFAIALGQDPWRWVALSLAAICTLFALAMPDTIDANREL